MQRHSRLVFVVLACLALAWAGCSSDDDPVKPDDDDDLYAPGTEWGGGDWPTLIAPEFGEDVIIGDPIPRVTAPYSGDFIPTLNCVRGLDWYLKVTRPEALCTAWYAWQTYGYHMSDALPAMTYKFNFSWECFVANSTLTDFNVSWPLTDNMDLKLMQNGIWLVDQKLPNKTQRVGGNDYKIERSFKLPTQPALHLSMARHWVQAVGADGDRTFPEGQIVIEHRVKSGVQMSTTTTFTKTTGWNAGIDIKGISAGLNQTFENSTSHTVALEEEKETIETRPYNIPANEQWRYIQLYGVERYFFSNAEGLPYASADLLDRGLGQIDNKVRNVLMIVKYRAGAKRPFSTLFLEDAEVVAPSR